MGAEVAACIVAALPGAERLSSEAAREAAAVQRCRGEQAEPRGGCNQQGCLSVVSQVHIASFEASIRVQRMQHAL